MKHPYVFNPSKPAVPAKVDRAAARLIPTGFLLGPPPVGDLDRAIKTVGQIVDETGPIVLAHTDALMEGRVELCHVVGLVTNLLHFCDSIGFDPDEVLARARDSWQVEGRDSSSRKCPACNGSGSVAEHDFGFNECYDCKGKGHLPLQARATAKEG